MKKIIPSILVSLTLFLGLVFVAHAQNYTPLAPLPGTVDTTTGSTNILTYLSGAIKLLIALGGALSILMAIIAGTKYVAAGISPDAKSNAKSDMTNAFIGLALILSSYLILNSISPNLVNFSLSLKPVNIATSTVTQGSADTSCLDSSLTPLTDDLTIRIENGTVGPVIWSDSTINPTVQAQLYKTKAEVDKLIAALGANSVTVTSAYRTFQYQQHLYEINNDWNGLNGQTLKLSDLNTVAWPGCVSLQQTVGAEYTKHGLLGLVANPALSAPHMNGTGVDIKLTGSVGYPDINAFMASHGIYLKWQNAPGDIVHFNYGSPQ